MVVLLIHMDNMLPRKILRKKQCLHCSGEVIIWKMPYKSQQKIEDNKRFCSSTCARQYGLKKSWRENRAARVESIRKVFADPVKGADIKKRISESQKGKRSNHWFGDKATYNSKHRWIQKHWKKTGICEFCGKTPEIRKNGASGTEWSNKSGNYDRNDRSDWQELCSSCHHFYDSAMRKAKKLNGGIAL